MNMARRSKISADKVIEEILNFVENSGCEKRSCK